MKCKLSEKCEFGNLCKDATRHDSLTVLGCSSFKTKKPMTNDEWRRTCSVEEFAEWLENKMMFAAKEQGTFTAQGWEKWLKEIYHAERM